MIRTWSVLAVAGLFAVVSAVPLAAVMSDEPTPAAVADLATLSKRVSDLEQRVRKLETSNANAATASPAAEDLPVLEIHSETWCGPCQVLKADLQALGQSGVSVKWVRFSDRVPALRWIGPDGKQVTQTGYTRGTIGSLLERVRAAHIARAAKREYQQGKPVNHNRPGVMRWTTKNTAAMIRTMIRKSCIFRCPDCPCESPNVRCRQSGNTRAKAGWRWCSLLPSQS